MRKGKDEAVLCGSCTRDLPPGGRGRTGTDAVRCTTSSHTSAATGPEFTDCTSRTPREGPHGRHRRVFVGDSIVRRWGATDYPELLANWKTNFFGWNAANFGWGADRTENILWRLENGELDGVRPKIIVILAGTNNIGAQPGGVEAIDDTTRGVKAIVYVLADGRRLTRRSC